MSKTRFAVGVVGGYLAAWLCVGYAVLAIAVGGPIDWPKVVQGGLIFAPLGSLGGVLVLDTRHQSSPFSTG